MLCLGLQVLNTTVQAEKQHLNSMAAELPAQYPITSTISQHKTIKVSPPQSSGKQLFNMENSGPAWFSSIYHALCFEFVSLGLLLMTYCLHLFTDFPIKNKKIKRKPKYIYNLPPQKCMHIHFLLLIPVIIKSTNSIHKNEWRLERKRTKKYVQVGA